MLELFSVIPHFCQAIYYHRRSFRLPPICLLFPVPYFFFFVRNIFSTPSVVGSREFVFVSPFLSFLGFDTDQLVSDFLCDSFSGKLTSRHTTLA